MRSQATSTTYSIHQRNSIRPTTVALVSLSGCGSCNCLVNRISDSRNYAECTCFDAFEEDVRQALKSLLYRKESQILMLHAENVRLKNELENK